jgi:hypothetical protein
VVVFFAASVVFGAVVDPAVDTRDEATLLVVVDEGTRGLASGFAAAVSGARAVAEGTLAVAGFVIGDLM